MVGAEVQTDGFRARITEPLRSDPIATLQRIIDYTPNTGGGAGGHDTDDNAMEYIGMARNYDGVSSLTQAQRIQLIRDLVPGRCGDAEEQAIIELLRMCSVSEMTAIVRDLGGGDAEQGVAYLDSGVDGGEWQVLQRLLCRSTALKEYL